MEKLNVFDSYTVRHIMVSSDSLYVGQLVHCPYYCQRRRRHLRDSNGNNKLFEAEITWLARRGLRLRERQAKVKYLDRMPPYPINIAESLIIPRIPKLKYREVIGRRGEKLLKENLSVECILKGLELRVRCPQYNYGRQHRRFH